MIWKIITKISLCLNFSYATSSLANDSIARVGSGGIELVKTEKIKMKKEILEISQKKIRVEYEFLNTSDVNIETLVGFPMPVYGFNLGESAHDINIGAIQDFSVEVNARNIKPHATFKALLKGREVSKELLEIGLSKTQIFTTFGDCKFESDLICGISASK